MNTHADGTLRGGLNEHPPCRHCGRPRRQMARGLCERCYRRPAVRELYGRINARRPRRLTDEDNAVLAAWVPGADRLLWHFVRRFAWAYDLMPLHGGGLADVVQDCFVQLLASVPAAELAAAKPRLLSVVARRAVIAYGRRAFARCRDAARITVLNFDPPCEERAEADAVLDLRLALDRLPPDYREALCLHWEGCTPEQIGARLWRTPAAAAQLLVRARARLALLLGRPDLAGTPATAPPSYPRRARPRWVRVEVGGLTTFTAR